MSIYPYRSRRRTSEHLDSPSRSKGTIDKHHVSSRITNILHNTTNLLATFNAFIRRMWRRLRPRQIVLLLLILSIIAITTVINQQQTPELPHQRVNPSNRPPQSHHEPPSSPATSHPMWSLITHSQNE